MKSQLLQSCQGREPLPDPPQREGVPPNHLKHSKNGLPPLGEGRGGALGGQGRGIRRAGVGLLQAAVFVPAPAGLFLPPTAAFFTVVTACVMQSMTVVMVPMPRRKTCFPTGIGDSTAKAKPPAVATAFCVYFISFGDKQINAHSGRPASSGNSEPKVTGVARAARKGNGVAFPQPRVAGEARYPGYI